MREKDCHADLFIREHRGGIPLRAPLPLHPRRHPRRAAAGGRETAVEAFARASARHQRHHGRGRLWSVGGRRLLSVRAEKGLLRRASREPARPACAAAAHACRAGSAQGRVSGRLHGQQPAPRGFPVQDVDAALAPGHGPAGRSAPGALAGHGHHGPARDDRRPSAQLPRP